MNLLFLFLSSVPPLLSWRMLLAISGKRLWATWFTVWFTWSTPARSLSSPKKCWTSSQPSGKRPTSWVSSVSRIWICVHQLFFAFSHAELYFFCCCNESEGSVSFDFISSSISIWPFSLLISSLTGIPQVLLMTKVDEACPVVAEDLKNVYRSVYIQKKVTFLYKLYIYTYTNDLHVIIVLWNHIGICSFAVFQARELSESLGIPVSCVMPVKNYSEELDLDQDTDTLLFTAVEQMLNYADSFFENQDTEDQEETEHLELYRSNDHHRPVLS